MSDSIHQAFSNIKSVLVVLSSRAMTIDQSGLRSLITHAYPGAAVFFISTSGDPVGVEGPTHVDLVIDFTEPGARQSLFFAYRMRSRGKHVVGRLTGWFFRKKKYDRILDEFEDSRRPGDYMASERFAQRKLLEIAGIPVVRQGGVTADLSHEISSKLPPLQNR